MNYEEAGIATMLAGLVRAREVLDNEIQTLQARLGQTTNGDAVREAKRRGAKGFWTDKGPEERSAIMKARWAKWKGETQKESGADKISTGQKSYWAKMTKEERRAEMQRRAGVRNKKWAEAENIGKLHPRDPRSPRHAEWLKTMSKAMKKSRKERAAVPAAKMQHVNGEAAA